MKLKFEVVIDASLPEVWAAFDNADNMRRWHPTLESYTHQSGEPGQPGAVAELIYDENGRKVVMTETVTERRAPHFLAGTYETQWGTTLIVNHFEALDDMTSKWQSWCNFSIKGFMKFMSLFLAKSIRRRTQADMDRFKLLVETDLAGKR